LNYKAQYVDRCTDPRRSATGRRQQARHQEETSAAGVEEAAVSIRREVIVRAAGEGGR
jgi:hypothetical protein